MPGGVITGDGFVPEGELRRRASLAATGLGSLGVGPGSPVAVLARNSPVHLEVSLAAALLGANVIPVNWRSKDAELCYVLEDSDAAALVGHADLLRTVSDSLPGRVRTVWAATPRSIIETFGVTADRATVPSTALDFENWMTAGQPTRGDAAGAASAGLFYTSGTTGRPKGVTRTAPTDEQVAQRQMALTMCYGIRAGCTSLVTTPLHHIFAQGMALATLRAGGTVVIMPRSDAESFLELVEQHQVTTAQMVPTMFVRLLRLPEARRGSADVSSLEHVLHTGAPCPAPVKRAMLDWWGPVLWEQYGSTETGVVALASPKEWLDHPGTVGRPFLTSEIRIYDEEGKPAPTGTVGHIYARMHGSPEFAYLGQPEATAAAQRDGLIRTGDLGYQDSDGFVFLADRSTDMVISGGVNIYPMEVEAVLLEHPDVHDAAVFGIPDEEYGEALIADVEPEQGTSLDPQALRSFLSARLAGHKVPRRFRLVPHLARDDSGKISKRRLREDYLNGS